MIWLLIGYMVLFIHRPFEIWPWLGDIKLERVYMIITLVAALASGRMRPNLSIIHFAVALFGGSIVLSCVLSDWASEKVVQDTVINWLKIVIFYLLCDGFDQPEISELTPN